MGVKELSDMQHMVIQGRANRSFVRRAGRLTSGQKKAIDKLASSYVLPYKPTKLNFFEIFANDNPVVFEIGFGMGDATAHIASVLPGINFIGCEVHQPGVGSLLQKIEQYKLANLKIIAHDAVEVLANMLPDNSLHGVHIFFPDPWHKKRHNKRRLIQQGFVAQLIPKLQHAGYIHCATDWQEYAQQMVAVFQDNKQLQNCAVYPEVFVTTPYYRPLTKFEQRGIRLGHGVWDILFKKI